MYSKMLLSLLNLALLNLAPEVVDGIVLLNLVSIAPESEIQTLTIPKFIRYLGR
eukprot:SAG31_NODE_8352_length_1468_cov_1.005844_1_plen_54_part_00